MPAYLPPRGDRSVLGGFHFPPNGFYSPTRRMVLADAGKTVSVDIGLRGVLEQGSPPLGGVFVVSLGARGARCPIVRTLVVFN